MRGSLYADNFQIVDELRNKSFFLRNTCYTYDCFASERFTSNDETLDSSTQYLQSNFSFLNSTK